MVRRNRASDVAPAHFLKLDQLTKRDREILLDSFLEGVRKSKELDLPRMLEANWRDIDDWARALYWLPSKETVRIRDFGPKRVTAGQPFNVQPDGRSAIWIEISRWAEPGLRIRLADSILETVLEGNVLTAAVPLSATAFAGQIPLVIVAPDGAARSEPIFLEAIVLEPIPQALPGLASGPS